MDICSLTSVSVGVTLVLGTEPPIKVLLVVPPDGKPFFFVRVTKIETVFIASLFFASMVIDMKSLLGVEEVSTNLV